MFMQAPPAAHPAAVNFVSGTSGASGSSETEDELSQGEMDMLARRADDLRREEEFLEHIRNQAHGESPLDDAQVLSPLDDAIADQPTAQAPNADHVDLWDLE